MRIWKNWPGRDWSTERSLTGVRWFIDAVLLFAAALVPLAPLFQGHIPGGHDLNIHLWRIAGIAEGLRDGMFPVRMQQIWFNHYGYPMGVMYGDVLLYFPALLHLWGLPLWRAYRAYVVFVSVLTAWTSWRFFYALGGRRGIALAGSVLYVWSVWRLTDIVTRAALGEYTAFAFLPLVAWGAFAMLAGERKRRAAALMTMGFTGLIQTHLLSTMMAGLFLLLVCIVFAGRLFSEKRWQTALLTIFLTATVNIGMLLPMADYLKNVPMQISQEQRLSVQTYGVFLSQLFARIAGTDVIGGMWGEDRPAAEEMPQTVGLALMVGLSAVCAILAVLFARKHDDDRRAQGEKIIGAFTFAALSVAALFMATKYMPYDWLDAHLPPVGRLLGVVQFPARYLEPAALFMCASLVLAGGLAAERGRVGRTCIAGLLLVLCAISGAQCASYVSRFMGTSARGWTSSAADVTEMSGFPEDRLYIPMGTDMERVQYASVLPEDDAFVVGAYGWEGATLLTEAERTADQVGSLDLPVFAYPGYRAWAISGTGAEEGMRFPVGVGDNNKLRVQLPARYRGTFAVRFIEPWYWRAAEALSLFSILLCLGVPAVQAIKRRRVR